MKKVISLALALAMCLSLCACGTGNTCTCDCAQCAQCEKNAQIVDTANVRIDSDAVKQNDNVIEFETPVVVAEDEYLRVELVKFYEEYRLWKQGYPHNADSATEGATLEKFAAFKFYNKTDHTLYIRMEDIYLGSDGAESFSVGSSSEDVFAGKNILKNFLIQTGEKETLTSMEELYSADGAFYIFHRNEDDVLHDGYRLEFSIPNGMTGNSETSLPDAIPLEQASSGQRVEEVIQLIDGIVLEDIAVSNTVKEVLDGIYTKYNALTEEERKEVTNYEKLNKAKDAYNELWVKSLIKIEKTQLYQNNYTSELELDIIWVNKSPKTIKYIYFTAGIKNSVGDYFTKNGQTLAIYQQTGPFKTNYRKPSNDAYWPTGLTANSDEVGGAVIAEIEIIYMDGSSAKIKENEIRFAFPK